MISNGLSNYQSGNLSAIFAEMDEETCEILFEQCWRYRERLLDFLTNNFAKLIKYESGQMYLAKVSSNTVDESDAGHDLLVRTSFQWSEVGNCDKSNDLYKYGFIDVRDGANEMNELSVTEERLNRLEFLVQQLNETKADDLLFNNQKETIRLLASGKPIGKEVNLGEPFGKEFTIREI